MSKFKRYLERTREAKERFSDWNAERVRVAKIKAKERHEEMEERLGRTEEIEKKRASIRSWQQKHIPKRKQFASPQQAARGFTAPPLFSFTNGDYRPKKKKKKYEDEYNLFPGL